MHSGIRVHWAKELLHWLDLLRSYGLELGSLFDAHYGIIVWILRPDFFTAAATGVDFDAFVDDKFFFIDFVQDHQWTYFLRGGGLCGYGHAHQKGGHYQCFCENVFQHGFIIVMFSLN
jgi:hypothetical protein